LSSYAAPPPPPPPPLAHAFASALPLAPHAPDALLMAVPKRKTTPSRKGKRSEGKHLRFAPFVSRCHVCNRVKGGPHVHCPHCGPGYQAAPVAPGAPDA
jgi:large subunit ribosomal protein L32